MHVIVVGAGEVGSYVAARLSHERHNVSVVDIDANRLRQLGSELDVLTVEGSGTHPSVLFDAGLDKCELVVAVTSNDEVNLVTSLIAKQRGVDKTIVRIEAEELRSRASAEFRQTFQADLVIDPDHQTAERILNLLDYPGASEIAVMAQGEAIVIGARLEADAPIVGRRLSEIAAEYEPRLGVHGRVDLPGRADLHPPHRLHADGGRPGAGGLQAASPPAGGPAPGSGHRSGPPRTAARRWPHRRDPRGPPGVEGS